MVDVTHQTKRIIGTGEEMTVIFEELSEVWDVYLMESRLEESDDTLKIMVVQPIARAGNQITINAIPVGTDYRIKATGTAA